jgi:hypothetical protein
LIELLIDVFVVTKPDPVIVRSKRPQLRDTQASRGKDEGVKFIAICLKRNDDCPEIRILIVGRISKIETMIVIAELSHAGTIPVKFDTLKKNDDVLGESPEKRHSYILLGSKLHPTIDTMQDSAVKHDDGSREMNRGIMLTASVFGLDMVLFRNITLKKKLPAG